MGHKEPRVDLYISKSADFAKPILIHIRKLVHIACPDVEEKMKWSFPHFDYKGMMCSMAAFKQHCAFGFWKAALMKDKSLLENAVSETAMGHLGKLKSTKDLPSDKKMIAYIKEARKLNEDGIKLPARNKTLDNEKTTKVPVHLLAVLKKNKKALKTFENFSPSHKREYIEWITEAKTDETKSNRIQTAVEWMSKGKPRNWKYMKKY